MTSRETHLVELVDTEGTAIGELSVADAHQSPGRLHRAFSVLLMDSQGRLLLQQRATAKTRFPGRWANTACGHPAPGEKLVTAAARRLAEEVGLTGVDLTEVGAFTYRADDPASGRVEHEYDHVLLGIIEPTAYRPKIDPAEVAALRWVEPSTLWVGLNEHPEQYAPWLPGVTRLALP
ncbi:isopentenyl-diphosphate Delta-isomerase [Allocatelliglobosispora scoriae]|uniref:isopentenyl-diphosphate Delta-isomerase n=1 Tax=Allocatelliglobosispora scoriae TaxID=643052 RepID=UPI00160B58A2|nr:isopentenyl-diphosphate Delta-isomerase [Allocatelliglobosispora scoriae]